MLIRTEDLLKAVSVSKAAGEREHAEDLATRLLRDWVREGIDETLVTGYSVLDDEATLLLCEVFRCSIESLTERARKELDALSCGHDYDVSHEYFHGKPFFRLEIHLSAESRS